MAIEVILPFIPFESTLKQKKTTCRQMTNNLTNSSNSLTNSSNDLANGTLATSDNSLTTENLTNHNLTMDPTSIPGVTIEDTDPFSDMKTGGNDHYPSGQDITSDYESSMNTSMISSSFDSSDSSDGDCTNQFLRPIDTRIKRVRRPSSGFSSSCLFNTSLDSGRYGNKSDLNEKERRVRTWDQLVLESDSALALWERKSSGHNYGHRSSGHGHRLNPVLKDSLKFVSPSCGDSNVSSLTVLPLQRRRSLDDFLAPIRKGRTFDTFPSGTFSFDLQTMADAKKRDANKVGANFEVIGKRRTSNDRMRSSTRSSNEGNTSRPSSGGFGKRNSSTATAHNLSGTAYAHQLLRGVKLTSPIYTAIQITSIDQGLFLQIDSSELVEFVLGETHAQQKILCGDLGDRYQSINRIIEFGKQLQIMIVTMITREISAHVQASKIAVFIEVATCLRKLRNWHSLSVVIESLQSLSVYKLTNSWSLLKSNYPVHFFDYVRLVALVNRSRIDILRSREPCLPSLRSLISLLKIQCASKIDLMTGCQRRWTQRESLVDWLESQLKLSGYNGKLTSGHFPTGQSSSGHSSRTIDKSRSRTGSKIQAPFIRESLFGGTRKQMDSFLPRNDPIHFITIRSLPKNWSLISDSLISGSLVSQLNPRRREEITDWFHSCFKSESNMIEKYSIFNHHIQLS